jgi:hypothetical protein
VWRRQAPTGYSSSRKNTVQPITLLRAVSSARAQPTDARNTQTPLHRHCGGAAIGDSKLLPFFSLGRRSQSRPPTS